MEEPALESDLGFQQAKILLCVGAGFIRQRGKSGKGKKMGFGRFRPRRKEGTGCMLSI